MKRLHRRYYKRHRKKKLADSKAWYEANKERRMRQNRVWRCRNPERVKLYRHNQELLEKRAIVPHASLTPRNLAELLRRQNGICAICCSPMTDSYTLDHIIPLSKGGPHAIYNIQLTHHHCNSMKQAKVSEKDIQKAIIEYLGYKKVFFYRNNSGAFKRDDGHFYRFGALGSPDIVCVIASQYIGIEVKAPKAKQSDHQKAFQQALEVAGGKYILAYSLDDVINSLEV